MMYHFNLPPEEQVLKRNRTITTYYAQLYKAEPLLYKWAGMAAFASFHIGEKLTLWDWGSSVIKNISQTCDKKNRSFEDDFQIIRILNNLIFKEIGSLHLAFSQLNFTEFKAHLIKDKKDPIIILAFEQLQEARIAILQNKVTPTITNLIWEANTTILWHEQSKVVQPLFNKLSPLFSKAMALMASFDYNVNTNNTNWKYASRFITFMLLRGSKHLLNEYSLPSVINLKHRWHWIANDLIKKWKSIESQSTKTQGEINVLASLENRQLKLHSSSDT